MRSFLSGSGFRKTRSHLVVQAVPELSTLLLQPSEWLSITAVHPRPFVLKAPSGLLCVTLKVFLLVCCTSPGVLTKLLDIFRSVKIPEQNKVGLQSRSCFLVCAVYLCSRKRYPRGAGTGRSPV